MFVSYCLIFNIKGFGKRAFFHSYESNIQVSANFMWEVVLIPKTLNLTHGTYSMFFKLPTKHVDILGFVEHPKKDKKKCFISH